MNTLLNRVKEIFNITPGVCNQKCLNYKRSLSAGLSKDAVVGNKEVAGVTEGHFVFNKLCLREQSCVRSNKYQIK